MRRQDIISKISKLMKRMFPEAKTLLYGSQARGTATLESDIDLLILLPDTYQDQQFVDRRNEIMDNLFDIEIEEGVGISPLVLVKSLWESRKTPFTINVLNEGIEI